MKTTRRDFMAGGVAALAALPAFAGERNLFSAGGGEKIRAVMLHMGMNMWCDWENPVPLGYGWEETVIRWPSDKVRADMSVWNS